MENINSTEDNNYSFPCNIYYYDEIKKEYISVSNQEKEFEELLNNSSLDDDWM